jgi:Ca2+-binding RTX toxin-like protein
MLGDDSSNSIFAFGDDDVINGKDADDHLFGDVGNDVISGGKGSDELIAGAGADRLVDGEGNDKIIQFAVSLELVSDGSMDVIDCGPGIDEAWINVSVDHDTASGCEIVHTG